MSQQIDPLRNNGKPWSDSDRELLRRLYPDEPNAALAKIFGRTVRSIKNEAVGLGVKKSDAYMATGPGQKKAGHIPWNKGFSYRPGGRIKESQFPKGHRPHSWVPIGSERVTKDGYLQRKMTDTGYSPRDWRPVHHLVWEQKHGRPVPSGHALIFRDGDKRNFDPDNFELLSRAENMQRNTIHRLPKELADVCRLKGVLNRKINTRSQA